MLMTAVVMTLAYNINEGLKVGDLKELVLPVVSIDEFESKIDPDAIVVAFTTLCTYEGPAEDLSEFIETGKNEVLDTDISAGPDKDGNYLLFVEFYRGEEFPANLIEVLKSLYSLTLNAKWEYEFFGGKGKKEITMENLKNDIRLKKKERDVTPNKIKESVNFFKNSMLDDVRMTVDNFIFLQKNNIVEVKENVAFGNPHMMLSALNLQHSAIQLDVESIRECNRIRKMLGENWEVTKIDDHFILENSEDERIMIIK
jgi:hypothetical protein